MRDAFTRVLQCLAAEDPNLLLVTGDLGFGVLKPFWEAYPDQFINAGIAEQAMTGLAAGLAREGKTVLTYSIGNFPTLRCLEQIRNDCAYHNANVKIVCVGGGFVYGSLGMSHQMCIRDRTRKLPRLGWPYWGISYIHVARSITAWGRMSSTRFSASSLWRA